jgi:hypothetical protein
VTINVPPVPYVHGIAYPAGGGRLRTDGRVQDGRLRVAGVVATLTGSANRYNRR